MRFIPVTYPEIFEDTVFIGYMGGRGVFGAQGNSKGCNHDLQIIIFSFKHAWMS